jgi:hypothetical protein
MAAVSETSYSGDESLLLVDGTAHQVPSLVKGMLN